MALALGLHRQSHHGFARRVHPELASVGHAQPEDVHVLARAGADGLGEEGDADAHQLTAIALFFLFGAQGVTADHVHGLAHGGLVVARVIDPSRFGGVRELLGLQQVAQPQFGGAHLEFEGQAIH